MTRLLLLALLLGGCPETPKGKITCKSNGDCPSGWVCLGGECADPSSKAVFTDPSHRVTGEKMKRQIEQSNDDRDKQIERVKDPSEQPKRGE